MYPVYLLTGSNEGDRLQQLKMAADLLAERAGPVTLRSSVYETASWGIESLPPHYNQALLLQTCHRPVELLNVIHEIENMLGRQRQQRWGLRCIDIDIIYFGDLNLIIDEPKLCIPHSLMQERKFVLTPLVEIAADYIHPVLQKTNQELLDDCKDKLAVKILAAATT